MITKFHLDEPMRNVQNILFNLLIIAISGCVASHDNTEGTTVAESTSRISLTEVGVSGTPYVTPVLTPTTHPTLTPNPTPVPTLLEEEKSTYLLDLFSIHHDCMLPCFWD